MYDSIIIGAGVIGCACAHALAKYQGKICVVDKEDDVGCGTSKANSAIIHAGYDAPQGTLMAQMNVAGNQMMEQLASDLDFPFRRNGSLVVCTSREDIPALERLLENGKANGVPHLTILEGEAVWEREPNLSPDVVAALYAPTAGIVCPFGMTIALGENAAQNGVEFRLNTTVEDITHEGGHFLVHTDNGVLEARTVINAAGVYSHQFHNLFSTEPLHITPRRGDYCLLDKSTGDFLRQTIFPLPTQRGKGILVAPTIHGNTIVGPTAIDVDDLEGTNTTAPGLEEVLSKARQTVPELPIRQVITSFAGLRAHERGHEFILGELAEMPGFFDCAGIESPGLSSAPAIGKRMAALLAEKLALAPNPNHQPTRRGILNPAVLTLSQRHTLIASQPAYGTVICRCEGITQGEILDAIRRPLGARSLDAVKRRTRAGMGRCQGGFCAPKVMELLAKALDLPLDAITKCGPGSPLIVGMNKDAYGTGGTP